METKETTKLLNENAVLDASEQPLSKEIKESIRVELKNTSNSTNDKDTEALSITVEIEEPLTSEEIMKRLEDVVEYNKQFENENTEKCKHSELFENLMQSYHKTVIQYCNEALGKARDVTYTQKSLIEKFTNALATTEVMPKKLMEAMDVFTDKYIRNDDFDIILNYIRVIYPEVFAIEIQKTSHEWIKPLPFLDQEEQIISEFPMETQPFIRHVCLLLVYDKVVLSLFTNKSEQLKSHVPTAPFKWTSDKGNKTEFVQIMYALHEAGLIDNGKGEITKIVEASAHFFNVNLSKHWQSNHSTNLHDTSARYQPPIFDKLLHAYRNYKAKQFDGKSKRKKGAAEADKEKAEGTKAESKQV